MSKTVTVYGASDDLIEVEGAITEEFNPTKSEGPDYLAFSDGTVLLVEYADPGVWHVRRMAEGSAKYHREENTGPDATYTDKVTLTGDLSWVVFGNQLVGAKK